MVEMVFKEQHNWASNWSAIIWWLNWFWIKLNKLSSEVLSSVMSSRVHSNSYSNHRSSRPSFSRQLRNRCSVCIRVFKWLPVLFIVSVLCWGYYAYVIQLNLFNIESVILKTLYLSVFHVIYVLTMWSYWQTIFTDSAHIPRDV